ncbi:MAG: hypothetical protein ACP5E2_10455, partial [Terracidiphilus sp.]
IPPPTRSALHMTNGPAGVGPGGAGPQKPATAMPAPIALAATWDPGLARTYGKLEAEEARSQGSQLFDSLDHLQRLPALHPFDGFWGERMGLLAARVCCSSRINHRLDRPCHRVSVDPARPFLVNGFRGPAQRIA